MSRPADAMLDVQENHDPMRYALAPIIRHRADALDLTVDQYRAIAAAKDGLVTLVGIEQKFDIVLENYSEYEQELLALAVQQVVFRENGYSRFQRETLLVIRRLSNLLSSCRMFIDQIKHDTSSVFGPDHPAVQTVRSKCSEEYDAALGYRLMETLRNVMQHRSLSGFVIKHSNDANPPGPAARRRMRLIPLLSVADLQEVGLKASVQQELGGAEYTELNGKVRTYVQGIANVHLAFRQSAFADRERWEADLRAAYDRGDATWPEGGPRASDLIAVDDAGRVSESRHVFLEPLDYLTSLEKKNQGPWALARSFVSSESGPDDA